MRPLLSPRPKRWDEVIRRMPTDRPILGVEVGVWEGKMSEQLLLQLPHLRLYLVDRWCVPPAGDSYLNSGAKISGYGQAEYDKAHDSTLRRTAFAGKRARILRMETGEAAAYLAESGKRFDFIFIDGDHSYLGVQRDIRLYQPLVRAGGWLCGHDYSTDPAKQGEVRRAVLEAFPEGIVQGVNSTWFKRIQGDPM